MPRNRVTARRPAVTWLTRADDHARAVDERAGGRAEPFVEYELTLST